MSVGVAELLILVVSAAAVLALVWLLVRVGGSDDAELWAASERVTLDATTTVVVRSYLRTSRNLRQVGAVGGLLLAPAVTAATGIDLQLPGLVWLLLGYLVGCLWAELALTRRPTAQQRTATLSPRRLTDYLPRTMLRVEAGAAVLAVGMGVLAATALQPGAIEPANLLTMSMDELEVAGNGAVLAGVLAPVVVGLTLLAQRRIVLRPQPLSSPEHVAVDDAMRSSSVRLVSATTIAIVGTLLSMQVFYVTAFVVPALSGWVTAGSLVLLVASLLQWRWWPHRGWVVLRSRSSGRPGGGAPVRQVTITVEPGGGHHG